MSLHPPSLSPRVKVEGQLIVGTLSKFDRVYFYGYLKSLRLLGKLLSGQLDFNIFICA